MSFETAPKPGLKQELEGIPYHKMKAEFKARGIESIWKAGTSKIELVKLALGKLNIIKKATQEVSEDENISDKVEEIEKEIKAKELILEERESMKLNYKLQASYDLLVSRYVEDGELNKEGFNQSFDKSKAMLKKLGGIKASRTVEAHELVQKRYL